MRALSEETGIHFERNSETQLYLPDRYRNNQFLLYNIGLFGSFDLDFSEDLAGELAEQEQDVSFISTSLVRSKIFEKEGKVSSGAAIKEVCERVRGEDNDEADFIVVDTLKNTPKTRNRFISRATKDLLNVTPIGIVHHATIDASLGRVRGWVESGRIDEPEMLKIQNVSPITLVLQTADSIQKPSPRSDEPGVFLHVDSMNFESGNTRSREEIIDDVIRTMINAEIL